MVWEVPGAMTVKSTFAGPPDCIVDICSTVAAMTMMGSVPMLWMTTLAVAVDGIVDQSVR